MDVRSALASAILLTMAAPALGYGQQRPLVTEDPETVGLRRVLIESGFELNQEQLFSAYGLTGDTVIGPTIGISIGASPTVEVQIDGTLLQRLRVSERSAAPLTQELALSDDTARGLGDFAVATKIRVAGETDRRPALGVRFGTKLPTAKRENGLGLGTVDFFASLLVGKTVQSVRTVGNISLLVLPDPVSARAPLSALGFGVSIARAVTNPFEIVGEVNGRLAPIGESVASGLESRGALRLAGRYTHGLLRVDAGLLVGITARDPTFGLSFGATYVIAP
jgi:hypothetical protein